MVKYLDAAVDNAAKEISGILLRNVVNFDLKNNDNDDVSIRTLIMTIMFNDIANY